MLNVDMQYDNRQVPFGMGCFAYGAFYRFLFHFPFIKDFQMTFKCGCYAMNHCFKEQGN